MDRLTSKLAVALMVTCAVACAEKPAEPPAEPSAQPPALASTCLECHRNEGGATIPGWPPLTAMSSEDIEAKLRGYREGGNPESRMTDVAHDFTDEEIRRIAEFYGSP